VRPEDWERAEEWFHRLAPLTVAERSDVLAEISASDPGLVRDIESLLTAHDSDGPFDRLTASVAPEFSGPAPPAALAGASVTHYDVGELVGRGGMGDVYRARDTRLNSDVALKFLPTGLSRDPSARDRFLVEARVVSSIDHPNVCTLLDIDETEGGRMFLVMPYYEGETLKTRLAQGPLAPENAVEIALQTARGLAAAHERGVIHRDIKPANLLLTDNGSVKILDFGVAKLADVSLTRSGMVPGTVGYMSPEQIAGDPVDARADLWALGAVLYEMLTGRRPGPTWSETMEGVPRALAEVAVRLLAASPEERYPDARAVVADLKVLTDGGDVLAPRPAAALPRFFAELKRRNVFRVTAVYGAIGFGTMQVAEVMFPRIPLPEWTVALVVWLVLLGFPVALVLAWAFETTPAGVRRTPAARPAILDAIVAQPAGRRWPIGVAGLLGGLLLAGGAWLGLQGRSQGGAAAPTVTAAGLPVAVLPFRAVNVEADSAMWYEGVVHLLSSSLESVDGLRKIDPTAVIRHWTAGYGEGGAAPDVASALGIARRLGARFALTGSAVSARAGASVRLTVEGYDLQTGRSTGSTYVEASADSVLSLVDQLAVAILRAEILPATDFRPEGLSRITTDSPEALNAYLEGERNFRRGRYDEAAAAFVRAADIDTTFARAMLRAATAYGGATNFELAGVYARRAAGLAHRLPARDSLLIASRLSDLSNWELYTTLYPDDADGWVQLGESYWHYGGKHLRPTSAYRHAWQQALSLSGAYTEQYVHLIEDAFARRDSTRARELLDAFAALDPERHPCPEFEHAYADTWGSEIDRERVRQQLPAPEAAGYSCGWTTLAAGSDAAVDAWEERDLDVLGRNAIGQAALWRSLQARLMRGEISRARRVLARTAGIRDLEEWAARFAIHWHLTDFPDSAAAARAADLLRKQPIVSGDPERFDLMAGSHDSPFWLGVLAVSEGRGADAESQAVRLEGAVDTIAATLPAFAAETGAMADAIRHYARLNRAWDSDLTEFEETLTRLRSIGFGKEEPEMFLRYFIGRELLARGNMHEAERYFRSFHPFHWSHYVPAQYHLGRIYEELDEPERAREHYRVFVEWWETADPELQPWVDEGRAALERLGAAGTDD